MDILAKRGVKIGSNGFGLCYLCKRVAEDMQHVFFECHVAYQVWVSCCAWLGLMTALSRDPIAHIQLFEASGSNMSSRRTCCAI